MFVVAADGNGDFRTIQEAVDHAPEGADIPVKIQIKNGVYREKLRIEKPNIHLLGEDPERTLLVYDDYALKTYPNGELYNTFNSYSVLVGASGFYAECLTIENDAGPGELVGQAVAAYVDGDRIHFRNCRFIGRQDTLFTGPLPPKPEKRASFGGPRDQGPLVHGRQYYESCYMEGDVDFIFGSATAVFEDCEIVSRAREKLTASKGSPEGEKPSVHGWITAASTPEGIPYGYVFVNCRLTGDAPQGTVYLGRPWRIYAKTAFIDCWLGEHIRSEGWENWNKPEAEEAARYVEIGSRGPGANGEGRVAWAYTSCREEDKLEYDIGRILAGEDGWSPRDPKRKEE